MITRFARLAVIAAFTVSIAACGSTTSTAPVTVTKTTVAQASSPAVATTTEAPAPAAQITIPDVAGKNAEIVRKELENLGLKDVNLSSANPKYSVVLLATNWTAVSIEPAPGTVVNADDPVIVKVTKE